MVGSASLPASGPGSLHPAVRHAKHAESVCADAVMAAPPIATSCEDSQLFRYYSSIIESVELPVVVQDASGYVRAMRTAAPRSGLPESLTGIRPTRASC